MSFFILQQLLIALLGDVDHTDRRAYCGHVQGVAHGFVQLSSGLSPVTGRSKGFAFEFGGRRRRRVYNEHFEAMLKELCKGTYGWV